MIELINILAEALNLYFGSNNGMNTQFESICNQMSSHIVSIGIRDKESAYSSAYRTTLSPSLVDTYILRFESKATSIG